jgi:hypothetical protein
MPPRRGPSFDGLGRFRVFYGDDRPPIDVRLNGRAVIEAERRWPGLETDGSDRYRPNEGVHYMVWVAAGRPEGDFEKWLDEGVLLEVLDDEPVPTTPITGVA